MVTVGGGGGCGLSLVPLPLLHQTLPGTVTMSLITIGLDENKKYARCENDKYRIIIQIIYNLCIDIHVKYISGRLPQAVTPAMYSTINMTASSSSSSPAQADGRMGAGQGRSPGPAAGSALRWSSPHSASPPPPRRRSGPRSKKPCNIRSERV